MPKQITKPATITVRVGPNLRSSINEYAKLREQTPSEFIRYCVLLYMDSTPTNPDDDWSDDTSTNGAEGELEIASIKHG
jgi:hypothetical protein